MRVCLIVVSVWCSNGFSRRVTLLLSKTLPTSTELHGSTSAARREQPVRDSATVRTTVTIVGGFMVSCLELHEPEVAHGRGAVVHGIDRRGRTTDELHVVGRIRDLESERAIHEGSE